MGAAGSLKILIDMNLSPDWASVFKQAGVESVHWSTPLTICRETPF